jgi:hypothetical protein
MINLPEDEAKKRYEVIKEYKQKTGFKEEQDDNIPF